MTVDWRQSVGSKRPMRSTTFSVHDTRRVARVLDAYRLSGTPFLLDLRTFTIVQAYDGILMEAHLQRELAPLGANVLRVQQVGGEPDDILHIGGNFELVGKYRGTRSELDALFSGDIPSVALRHETWRDAVKELIASTEVIVSELQFLTPGSVMSFGRVSMQAKRIRRF